MVGTRVWVGIREKWGCREWRVGLELRCGLERWAVRVRVEKHLFCLSWKIPGSAQGRTFLDKNKILIIFSGNSICNYD